MTARNPQAGRGTLAAQATVRAVVLVLVAAVAVAVFAGLVVMLLAFGGGE